VSIVSSCSDERIEQLWQVFTRILRRILLFFLFPSPDECWDVGLAEWNNPCPP
jgi:hypothetical protein